VPSSRPTTTAGDRTETVLNVRIPSDVHEAAKQRAAEEDRTVSQLVRRALKLYLLGEPA
jgi:predicted HicB family RNase H-like nuclease